MPKNRDVFDGRLAIIGHCRGMYLQRNGKWMGISRGPGRRRLRPDLRRRRRARRRPAGPADHHRPGQRDVDRRHRPARRRHRAGRRRPLAQRGAATGARGTPIDALGRGHHPGRRRPAGGALLGHLRPHRPQRGELRQRRPLRPRWARRPAGGAWPPASPGRCASSPSTSRPASRRSTSCATTRPASRSSSSAARRRGPAARCPASAGGGGGLGHGRRLCGRRLGIDRRHRCHRLGRSGRRHRHDRLGGHGRRAACGGGAGHPAGGDQLVEQLVGEQAGPRPQGGAVDAPERPAQAALGGSVVVRAPARPPRGAGRSRPCAPPASPARAPGARSCGG